MLRAQRCSWCTAVVRHQDGLPRGASTQKGLPVRVGLLLELGAWR